MDALGPENASHAIKPAEIASGHIAQQINNSALGIENQLHGTADIANARSFFVPKVDMPAAPLTGLEHSGAAAVKAASAAISPMLQLILRLPGHLGMFSSFMEAFKNLFLPHTNLLSHLNPGSFVQGMDLSHSVGHLGQSLPALSHGHAIDLSIVPNATHAFHGLPGEFLTPTGTPHLHMNAFDSWKQSMNVSAGVDLKNPQFEGAPASGQINNIMAARNSQLGDSLAGPGLSAQSITPKLAPAERVFNSSFLDSPNTYSNASNLLAANSPSPSITGGATNASASSIASASPVANMSSTYQSPSTLSGLQAKALSFKDVLHKGHAPAVSDHKHVSNNPFAKLASSTKQAFQSAHKDVSATNTSAYKIKSGDNLWQIARRELGSGMHWRDIYNINQVKIGSNPDLIYAGNSINIPKSGLMPSAQPAHAIDSSIIAHAPTAHVSTTHAPVTHAPVTHAPVTHAAVAHAPATHAPTVDHSLAKSVDNVLQKNHVAHVEKQLAHNTQSQAPSSKSVTHSQVKHEHTVAADGRLAQVPTQQMHAHGLKVEKVHDELLSGAGGARAATNVSANGPANAPNHASSTVSKTTEHLTDSKAKSVVSFSLTPDLSILDKK
jgi:nucleoid-associated protein YgaU